jgi:predicted regulator of Ras-like GTPase activity (Roadblock/LC7/MglB family)
LSKRREKEMAKKRKSQLETTTAIIMDEEELGTSKEEELFTKISNNLAEIRKEKGIKGYILRSSTSAIIDLREPERVVEYAIFSSQVLYSSQELSNLFKLNDVKSVFIEGKESKTLCLNIHGNKIGVFMEKNVDSYKILKKISP